MEHHSVMSMKPSDWVPNFLKQFEGLARVGNDDLVYPYKDSSGYPTQGYGRLLSKDTSAPLTNWPPITKDEAEAWFAHDVGVVADQVNSAVKVTLDQAQFDALVSLTFNIGIGQLLTSTLLRKLNAHDYLGAAGQFVRWNKNQHGKPVLGLTRRRAAERDHFLRG